MINFIFILFQSLSETQSNEIGRLQQTLADNETVIRKLEHERRDLMQNQGTRRATISGLEEQSESLRNQLRSTQNDLDNQKVLYTQLK